MQQRHLQQLSSLDIYVTTCKILLLFFLRRSYVMDRYYLVLILKFYTVAMLLHVKNVLNKRAFSSKHMWNYDIGAVVKIKDNIEI